MNKNFITDKYRGKGIPVKKCHYISLIFQMMTGYLAFSLADSEIPKEESVWGGIPVVSSFYYVINQTS